MSADVRADGGDPAERLAAAREELRAAEESVEAMIDAIEGEKRVYEGHIDAVEFDI